MEKLDLVTFDERFENVPEKKGEEQSEMDIKRDQFIAENALDYLPEPAYPKNIAGSYFNPKSRKKIFINILYIQNLSNSDFYDFFFA